MITRLPVDHTNSTTTKTDITQLFLSLAPSTNYAFEFVLRTTSNAATVGVQFALTWDDVINRIDADMEYWSAATTKAVLSITGVTASPQVFNPIVSQGNVEAIYVIRGIIEVGVNGVFFGIQHGSETASLTTVQRGSYLVAVPVT